MPYCVKANEFDPNVHVKISGPHTLAECQQICGQQTGMMATQTSGCGCSKKVEMFEVVESVNA